MKTNTITRTFVVMTVSVWSVIATHAQTMTLREPSLRSTETFHMGTATNPEGHTLLVDSKSLLRDGQPWLPVMGEIHFSRVPRQDWHRELLKMKAGGVTIVASYVFWIHHEEQPGRFDWSGQRDLRAFVEECQTLGLPVVLRVGPFAHGEARNGGFPDWVINTGCKMRSNDKRYLSMVDRWFDQLYAQVCGLFYKDGGPIVGIQVENECRGPWSYMMALKDMLVRKGFDVPFYTRTGWPKMTDKATFGDLLPLYGDYADGFWDRSMNDMPGDYPAAFTFKPSRLSTVIATEQLKSDGQQNSDELLSYPYFTCELGGGMMTSYARRIHIFPNDALALAICKVGSGSNLPGYYMYHGGTNPDGQYVGVDGQSTTLNENQSCLLVNYNEMPIKTYDFQAPLGEVGQPYGSYPLLRRLHQMLADFGPQLSSMDAQFPEDGQLRWSVRSDGRRGFIFANNYERLKSLGDKRGVKFSLTTADGRKVTFPAITIADGLSFVMPFGLQVGDAVIDYATAQPFCILRGAQPTVVFAAIKGIKPVVKISKGQKGVNVRVLTPEESLVAQKIDLGDRDTLIFSKDIVYRDAGQLCYEHWEELGDVAFTQTAIRDVKRKVMTGAKDVGIQPMEADFRNASTYDVHIPVDIDAEQTYLRIDYDGDVARLYADGRIVQDNFWNGQPMYARMSELKGKKVVLRILPLYDDYPVYLQPAQRQLLQQNGGKLLKLNKITALSCTRKS